MVEESGDWSLSAGSLERGAREQNTAIDSWMGDLEAMTGARNGKSAMFVSAYCGSWRVVLLQGNYCTCVYE